MGAKHYKLAESPSFFEVAPLELSNRDGVIPPMSWQPRGKGGARSLPLANRDEVLRCEATVTISISTLGGQQESLQRSGQVLREILKGGRWTENQYGGVMDDAGVCLDACGWDDASLDCSTRRRTDSLSNDPL